MINKITHIAIAVNNFNNLDSWRALFGKKCKEKRYVSRSQDVDALVFFNDKINIEFIKPRSSKSPISNFLKKNKFGGIHHLSFEVENFEKDLKKIKSKNIRTISRGSETKGIKKNKICFLNPIDLNGVLVELEEKKGKK